MRMQLPHPVRFIVYLALAMVLVALFTNCNVEKRLEKQKYSLDSSYSVLHRRLSDSVAEYKARYQKLLNEKTETGIVFDDTPCPPMPDIDSACNKDSLVKIIRLQADQLRAMSNEVKINKDGSIEAKGRIKGLNVKNEKLVQENIELSNKVERQAEEIERLNVAVSKKQVEKIVEKETTWFPWWLLIAAFIAGCIFWHHRVRVWRFFKLIKTDNMKLFLFMLATLLAFSGCSTYHDEPAVSVWSGGNWLVFWVPFVGSIILFIAAYRSHRSGWKQQQDAGVKTLEGADNTPIWQIPFFWFAVFLLLVSIGAVIYFNSDWHR